MFMSATDYRESLRRYSPRVFIDGHAVESVADDPRLEPGIAAIGVSYDFARNPDHAPLLTARRNGGGALPRVLAIARTPTGRADKLAARRAWCGGRARRKDGTGIRGAKGIVTAAPYVHEFLVMPCRRMRPEDAAFAVCCAVPVDAPGVTIAARPAGRPGEAAAKFSARYGQSTGVMLFEDVFVPWERVSLAGERAEAALLTTSYTTHHRPSCIGARARLGD